MYARVLCHVTLTLLYGVIRGKPPQFFDGHATAFTGLRFHLDTETFGFYLSLRCIGTFGHRNPVLAAFTR